MVTEGEGRGRGKVQSAGKSANPMARRGQNSGADAASAMVTEGEGKWRGEVQAAAAIARDTKSAEQRVSGQSGAEEVTERSASCELGRAVKRSDGAVAREIQRVQAEQPTTREDQSVKGRALRIE
jgi:hypothetical protein